MLNILLKLNKKLLSHRCSDVILSRTYQTLFSKEFDVSQFCTLLVKCPYNINIKPIDVFQSQEKTYVNINSSTNSAIPKITTEKQNDTILIDVSSTDNCEDCTLNIDTSIKASIDVKGNNGDINIGSFYGQFVTATSANGHINLSKTQCKKISLITNNGNIVCRDVTQAGDITLQSKGSGNIIADRLQGLKLIAFTSTGRMNIGSSYCDISTFESDIGQLTLNNLHKHVTVNVKHAGLLNIVGLDGDLYVHMKKGLADIQLARIVKESTIVIEDQGSLILRLSDECQKDNLIEILTETIILSDSLKMECEKNNEFYQLFPRNKNVEEMSKIQVKCKKSDVLVNTASWSELFQASFKNRS